MEDIMVLVILLFVLALIWVTLRHPVQIIGGGLAQAVLYFIVIVIGVKLLMWLGILT